MQPLYFLFDPAVRLGVIFGRLLVLVGGVTKCDDENPGGTANQLV